MQTKIHTIERTSSDASTLYVKMPNAGVTKVDAQKGLVRSGSARSPGRVHTNRLNCS